MRNSRFVLLIKYYLNDQIKKDEEAQHMAHMKREEKYVYGFVSKPDGKDHFEYNIKYGFHWNRTGQRGPDPCGL
jgi:hypothetical protein